MTAPVNVAPVQVAGVGLVAVVDGFIERVYGGTLGRVTAAGCIKLFGLGGVEAMRVRAALPAFVKGCDLAIGSEVAAPAWVRDENGRKVPIAELWPGHPPTLRVSEWDWEGGESLLEASHGDEHLDANVCDYPPIFAVIGGAK